LRGSDITDCETHHTRELLPKTNIDTQCMHIHKSEGTHTHTHTNLCFHPRPPTPPGNPPPPHFDAAFNLTPPSPAAGSLSASWGIQEW
jgi:hypothetical protein